jgi:methionyl aminopeptidase
MSIESAADWKGLRRVARVVRLTLDALEAHVETGISTGELDQIAAAVFSRHRARSAPTLVYGFPGTVLISVNDEVVHGVPGARRLAPGDLVKLDVTAELDGYVADAARTVIVRSVSARDVATAAPQASTAERLQACAADAFKTALRVARAGQRVNEIGRAVQQTVARSAFHVIRGLDGHGVGRTIHEPPSVPNWYDPSQRDILTDGLVMTIEPIIAAGTSRVVTGGDGWTIRTQDGSLSAHHEHTIVITRGEPVVLTAVC